MQDNWYVYHKQLYESCSSNKDFLDVLKKYPDKVKSLDESIFLQSKNTDINISQENLNELFLKNKLKTIRLGNVESRFLIKQVFDKDVVGDFEALKDKKDDFRMRNNAGLYFSDGQKEIVHEWWCKNTSELLKNPETSLTSCYLFLAYDLFLLSLFDIKNKYLNNFGLLVDLILLFENKKVLLISNGVESMKNSFDSGLQRAYKKTIPNFSLYCLKSPQTTIGMPYPHTNSKETTEWMVDEITKKFGDFDVALLACGCYGAPLTNLLSKKLPNKNIIYMGSMLYTMFGLYSQGILKPIFAPKLFNTEGFIEISEKCPDACKKIENGKYWN